VSLHTSVVNKRFCPTAQARVGVQVPDRGMGVADGARVIHLPAKRSPHVAACGINILRAQIDAEVFP